VKRKKEGKTEVKRKKIVWRFEFHVL